MTPAPDSPRPEERAGWRTDLYFHRGAYLRQWGDRDPVLGFHRPLRDYWEAFVGTGFTVDGFEEPSITERGRRELPRRLRPLDGRHLDARRNARAALAALDYAQRQLPGRPP